VVERGVLIAVKNTAGSTPIPRQAPGYRVPKIIMTPFAARGRLDLWKPNSVAVGTVLIARGGGPSVSGSSWTS